MKQNILIRADASAGIGIGHIMRDLVLAKQFENAKVIFATREFEGNINQKIKDEGFEVEILGSNDRETIDTLIKKLGIDLLVIDHYGIGYHDEKYLKTSNPNLKILSFDDTYEKHHCDILLNHNISADKSRYKVLVPEFCELRCGSEYTLIRDEFYKAKKSPKIYHDKPTIMIAMGGSDPSNITPKVLDVVSQFDCKALVVTTAANPHLIVLKSYCHDRDFITLYVDTDSIATLMRQSDLAIVTPSVTLNEVVFMGLDFVAIKSAENQEEMYRYLLKKKNLVLSEFDREKLFTLLQKGGLCV